MLGGKILFFFKFDQKLSFPLTMQIQFQPCWSQNIRRRVFSPASLENIYLQKWIDKLQQMLPSTISILFVVILRMRSIINIKVKNSFDLIWATSPKKKSTSRMKIVLTKYGELLLLISDFLSWEATSNQRPKVPQSSSSFSWAWSSPLPLPPLF